MPIEVSCRCGREISVPEKYAGRRGKCPACQSVLLIPILDEPAIPKTDAGTYGDPGPYSGRGSASPAFFDSQISEALSIEDEDEEVVTPIDDEPPSSSPLPIDVTPSMYRGAAPPEPWFYGWLDGFAKVVWILSKVILLSVLILATVVGVLGSVMAGNPSALVSAIAFIVAVAASMLSSFVLSALVMLAVDAARNIRAARHR